MIDSLNLSSDAPLDIEEFVIQTPGPSNSLDDVRMITVAVPDHSPRVAGLLGVAYVASGEPLGKAGAYAVQGRAAAYISRISGSYSGIMGLPVFETAQLLHSMGFKF